MNEMRLAELLQEDGRRTHRAIVERWVIRGQLVLQTPAHFGAGEAGDYTDMPLLLDEQGRPLLPGTSIAGALRNALRERQLGDGTPLPKDDHKAEQQEERRLMSTRLFGFYQGDDDDEGRQSPLIVEDAPGHAPARGDRFELRDGVAIDGKTRTAAVSPDEAKKERGKKFDMELLAAGTTFDLGFELIVSVPYTGPNGDSASSNHNARFSDHRHELLRALATTLGALERGEITLGARKRRGFGQCLVKEWAVRRYDLTTRDGLLAWLARERDYPNAPRVTAKQEARVADAIAALSGIPAAELAMDDNRRRVSLQANFAVESSLLIRAGMGQEDQDAPDMVHLHSWRDGHSVPIVAGTSWAGVLRHRAVKIAKTLGGPEADDRVKSLIDCLFGPAEIKKEDKSARASRLSVHESTVTGGRELVQTRVRIDRFTGGALDTGLFDEQPHFGAGEAAVELSIEIRSPAPQSLREDDKPVVPAAEVGLLLLLLKDLWTGDLRVGGEASVGRGVLSGRSAVLTVGGETYRFTDEAGKLVVEGDRKVLQGYVDALVKKVE